MTPQVWTILGILWSCRYTVYRPGIDDIEILQQDLLKSLQKQLCCLSFFVLSLSISSHLLFVFHSFSLFQFSLYSLLLALRVLPCSRIGDTNVLQRQLDQPPCLGGRRPMLKSRILCLVGSGGWEGGQESTFDMSKLPNRNMIAASSLDQHAHAS